jgi:hypothetical protein
MAQDRKQMTAVRVEQAPVIDGSLDEAVWQQAQPAGDFIQRETQPGQPATQPTEVRIIYDNVAVYIGAMMHDVSGDSVLNELGKRDTEGNTDLFGLVLDTYNDDINAYGFFITASGVQIDARYSSDGQDFNWNAVWESSVRVVDKGWIAEFKIPYSAIRFGKNKEQLWGVNFLRKIRRLRENDFWNKVDPSIDGFIIQSGDLLGISNIEPPLRLSVTPYVSAYVENYPYNQEGKSNNSYSLRGGMDLKYGISESFTLDMTLVPDFGQVQSDNQVLNLSPFEVMYNENRPFFMEGTELFNKGNLFYSRRVGGRPIGYYDAAYSLQPGEELVQNPEETQLINAAKISGRTKNKLGIGLFNATTAEMYATIKDSLGNERKMLTQPLSNYSVLVFDQALKNNSYVDVINTNVIRDGNAYDANVTGSDVLLRDKKNKHFLSMSGFVSQKYFADSTKPELGHITGGMVGKSSGNFQWNLGARVISNTYDPNDLGILFMNNTFGSQANLYYNIYSPFWKVNNIYNSLSVTYERRYFPGAFANFGISGETFTTFTKRFISAGAWFGLEPIITYDFFEPRVEGRYYTYPTNFSLGYWISSDYRKKFALDLRTNFRKFNDEGRVSLAFNISPRYRFSNKFSMVYSVDRNVSFDDVGFADFYGDTIVFGRRDLQTVSNVLNANYTFTNKMALTFRARHYWSIAKYRRYYALDEKGMLQSTTYNGNQDVNFNAFNIDMVYTWQFAPGSEMSIVWKDAILTLESERVVQYFDNVQNTLDSPQTNSFSIKVLYYLDYLYLKRKKS